MFTLLLLLSASSVLSSAVNAGNNYKGWRVLEVLLEDNDGISNIFAELQKRENPSYLQIFRVRRDKGVAEVAVSPDALKNLRQQQRDNKITFNTVINDLSRKVSENSLSLRATALPHGEVTFDRFMNVEEIMAYVEDLPHKYPDKVSLKKVGDSIENRPIYLVTITTNTKNSVDKPVIFVDGGIHAREWITPAAALNVIEQLVTSPSLTRDLEWQIIPLLNPDGYAYTWTHDRLWRKNRANNSEQCSGTDLNRNFDFHWGESGISENPCSNVYLGREPFSEPESRALRDAMTPSKSRIKSYVTIHSYGQYILHSWGYTTDEIHVNESYMLAVGDGMAKAIKRNDGTVYSVGSAAKLLYAAAGGSDDWAAGELNIPLVYTLELRDEGAGGFILPEYLIKPTITDAWLALKYIGRQLIKKGGMETEEETGGAVIEGKTRVVAEALQKATPERIQETPVSPPAPVVRDIVYSRPQQTRLSPVYIRPTYSRRYGGSSKEDSSSEESWRGGDSDEDRK